MPLLEVEDLTVSFHTPDGIVKAVRDVSFTVDAGKTLGIVGESGSGKSVSTQTIMGLTQGARISGRAMFEGKKLHRFSRSPSMSLVRRPRHFQPRCDGRASERPLHRARRR